MPSVNPSTGAGTTASDTVAEAAGSIKSMSISNREERKTAAVAVESDQNNNPVGEQHIKRSCNWVLFTNGTLVLCPGVFTDYTLLRKYARDTINSITYCDISAASIPIALLVSISFANILPLVSISWCS